MSIPACVHDDGRIGCLLALVYSARVVRDRDDVAESEVASRWSPSTVVGVVRIHIRRGDLLVLLPYDVETRVFVTIHRDAPDVNAGNDAAVRAGAIIIKQQDRIGIGEVAARLLCGEPEAAVLVLSDIALVFPHEAQIAVRHHAAVDGKRLEYAHTRRVRPALGCYLPVERHVQAGRGPGGACAGISIMPQDMRVVRGIGIELGRNTVEERASVRTAIAVIPGAAVAILVHKRRFIEPVVITIPVGVRVDPARGILLAIEYGPRMAGLGCAALVAPSEVQLAVGPERNVGRIAVPCQRRHIIIIDERHRPGIVLVELVLGIGDVVILGSAVVPVPPGEINRVPPGRIQERRRDSAEADEPTVRKIERHCDEVEPAVQDGHVCILTMPLVKPIAVIPARHPHCIDEPGLVGDDVEISAARAALIISHHERPGNHRVSQGVCRDDRRRQHYGHCDTEAAETAPSA